MIAEFMRKYFYSLIPIIAVVFLPWYYKPDNKIYAFIFVPFSALLLTAISILLQLLIKSQIDRKAIKFPNLKLCNTDNETIRYIFSPPESKVFLTQTLVSIYKTGNIDKLIAIGKLEVVNAKGFLQVIVIDFIKPYMHEDLEKKHYNNIILRPNIPDSFVVRRSDHTEDNNDVVHQT